VAEDVERTRCDPDPRVKPPGKRPPNAQTLAQETDDEATGCGVVAGRGASVDPQVAAVAPAQLLQGLCERREAGLSFRVVRGPIMETKQPDKIGRDLGEAPAASLPPRIWPAPPRCFASPLCPRKSRYRIGNIVSGILVP
jgi:hypothetical protein